jgi:hypothetical protein
MGAMARATDSNVAHYERAARELPSANLSITLPILLMGLEQDAETPVVDVSRCCFNGIKEVTKAENRWRIVNGYMTKSDMATIGPKSDPGPMLADQVVDDPHIEPGETAT